MTTSLSPRAAISASPTSRSRPFGRKEIHLAEHEMPGLRALRKEYGPLQAARVPASRARCT